MIDEDAERQRRTGVILFPISRKLGFFLEQAAKERAERLARGVQAELPDPTSQRQLVEALTSIESQMGQLAERQTFTERLLEERAEPPPTE